MRAAFSEDMSKNLTVRWGAYILFCKFYGLKPIPTTIETLCLFRQFLSRSFKSVESERNYISGVKTLHQVSDVKYPSDNMFQLTFVLRGLAPSLTTKGSSYDSPDFAGYVQRDSCHNTC